MDYEAVPDFVHGVQDATSSISEMKLKDVYEADEIYVIAGEKGVEDEDESPRRTDSQKGGRNLRRRQTAGRDACPSV